MNTRPCRRATSRIAPRRVGCTTASTARIAFVRGVIACSMRPASMFAVPGSISANTGFALSYMMQLLDVMRPNGTVKPSSPSNWSRLVRPGSLLVDLRAESRQCRHPTWHPPIQSAHYRLDDLSALSSLLRKPVQLYLLCR